MIETAHINPDMKSVVMIVAGAGMVVGNLLGGWITYQSDYLHLVDAHQCIAIGLLFLTYSAYSVGAYICMWCNVDVIRFSAEYAHFPLRTSIRNDGSRFYASGIQHC